MEPWRALIAGCKSWAPVHLSFSAGQYDHLSRLGLRRQRFVEQKVPRFTYRLVSWAITRVGWGGNVCAPRGIAPRTPKLKRPCIPPRLREDAFHHADAARA